MSTATLTTQQRRVVETATVHLVGWDAKGRPVVSGLVGIPQRRQTWALLKNGDPADITSPISQVEQ